MDEEPAPSTRQLYLDGLQALAKQHGNEYALLAARTWGEYQLSSTYCAATALRSLMA